MSNPNTSEESKEHSRQIIDDLENDPETQAQREQGDFAKNEGNVIGGFKATLKSEYDRAEVFNGG